MKVGVAWISLSTQTDGQVAKPDIKEGLTSKFLIGLDLDSGPEPGLNARLELETRWSRTESGSGDLEPIQEPTNLLTN